MRNRENSEENDAKQEATAEAEPTVRQQLDAAIKALKPKTVGEAIDKLGVHIAPEHARFHETAVKALVILVSEHQRIPGVATVSIAPAGDLNMIEAIGLLDIAKRDLLSERSQDENMRRALTT